MRYLVRNYGGALLLEAPDPRAYASRQAARTEVRRRLGKKALRQQRRAGGSPPFYDGLSCLEAWLFRLRDEIGGGVAIYRTDRGIGD